MTSHTPGGRRFRRPPDLLLVPLALVLLLVAAWLTIALGPRTLTLDQVTSSLTAPTGSEADLIVWDVRVPKMLIGVAVGAALAVAGVLMQLLTRNPLAEPGLLGVNAGASLAVAVAVVMLKISSFTTLMGFAFVGAAVASAIVAVLGGIGQRASIGRLALAGVATAAVLSAATSAISLVDPKGFQAMRVWAAGSLNGRTMSIALAALLVVAIGLVLVAVLTPSFELLALGEDTARSLGGRVGIARVGGFLLIAVLCGAATAAAGPIAFVGLLVPHALRAIFGADTKRLLIYSALAGPILVLLADVLANVVIAPRVVPIGVMMAFLGAPLLVALVLSRRVQAEGVAR